MTVYKVVASIQLNLNGKILYTLNVARIRLLYFSKCSYAAELHIVHYALKYGSVAKAFKHEDGVAV